MKFGQNFFAALIMLLNAGSKPGSMVVNYNRVSKCIYYWG